MPTRSGSVIPLVILCLVVMAILGVVLITNATSQYMQTAKVAVQLKLREIVLAGMEEAQAAAYDRLNRPPARGQPPPPWHSELLAALAGGSPRGVLVKHDLKAERLLARTAQIASTLQCEVTSASAELSGFRRLSVDSRGLFDDGRIYYHDPDGVLDRDEAKFAPPREWVGTLTVKVTVRQDRNARTMTSVKDVKVVDVSPVAREFVLFSFLSSSRQQDGGPESDDYSRNDLRRGGRVSLYGANAGRVFVRGPFLVDTVGYPGGDGGKSPPRSPSYYPIVWNEWWGWSQVPATHDGIMTRAGITAVNFAMPPMRPETRDTWRLFKGLVTERFGSAWTDWFDDDPGYYILDGQRWYCESTGSDRSFFSIWGDPAAGRMDPFRGVLALYDDGGRHPRGVSTSLSLGASLQRPGDEEKRWVIEPEGGLFGTYNVVEYHGNSRLGGTYQGYDITGKGQVTGRLGLHWEKRYELSWFRQFVIDLIRGPTIWGTLPSMLISRATAESLSLTLAALVGVDLSAGNGLTELSGVTADTLANAFPPGYRPPVRSVTRRYRRLSDLQVRVGQRPLVLDGVLAFDEMASSTPIAYQGRGVFFSEEARAPTLTAPITPASANDASSYLVIHHEGPVRQAHRGNAMLNLRAGGGRTVNAAVYATQGVKPYGAIAINGNLTCGYLNKGQVPDSSSLEVHYRPPEQTGPVCAVSPRHAFVLDR